MSQRTASEDPLLEVELTVLRKFVKLTNIRAEASDKLTNRVGPRGLAYYCSCHEWLSMCAVRRYGCKSNPIHGYGKPAFNPVVNCESDSAELACSEAETFHPRLKCSATRSTGIDLRTHV